MSVDWSVDWARTCEYCKGYPTTLTSCACEDRVIGPTPRFEPSPPMPEHEKQRIADALKMSGLNYVVGYTPSEQQKKDLQEYIKGAPAPTAPDRPSNVSAVAPDPVNNPPHYNQGAVECIDAIESALGPAGFRAYCKGNALKYIWREEHKGGTESIEKAIWYLDRLVSGR